MRLIVTIVMLSTLTSIVFAQRGFRRGFAPAPDQPLVGEPKEWTFARLAYDGGGFRGGGSWAGFGTDPFGYNARCARIAIENAAASLKPPLAVPAGYDARTKAVALEADVPQFLSYRVRVAVAPESKQAVPAAAGTASSPDAAAFNDAWTKYEDALRKAAAQKTMPSAIECPREELAAVFKFLGALSGKE